VTGQDIPPSIYDEILNRHHNERSLRRAANVAAGLADKRDPSEIGEALQMARKFKSPLVPGLEALHQAKVKEAAQGVKPRSFAERFPALSRRLENPDIDFTSMTRDDMGNLTETENWYSWLGRSFDGSFTETMAKGLRLAGIPIQEESKIDREKRRQIAQIRGERDTGAVAWGQDAIEVVKSLAAVVGGGLVGGLVGGPPGAAVGATSVGYVLNSGDVYGALQDAGFTPEQSAGYARGWGAVMAGIDAASAGLASNAFSKTIGKRLLGDLLSKKLTVEAKQELLLAGIKEHLIGWSTETITEVVQQGASIAARYQAHLKYREGEAFDVDIKGELFDTFVHTARGMAVVSGAGATVRAIRDQRRAANAKLTAEAHQRMETLEANSKLRQRDPESREEFNNDAAPDSIKTAYIRADKFLEQVEAAEKNDPDFREKLENSHPGLLAKAQEASQSGGNVEVPVGQWSTLALGDFGRNLMPHTVYHQDADTQFERGEIDKIGAGYEPLMAEAAKRAETDSEFAKLIEGIYDYFYERGGVDQPNITRDQRAANASLSRAIIMSLARDEGIELAEYWQKYGPSIAGSMQSSTEVSQQALPELVTSISAEEEATTENTNPTTQIGSVTVQAVRKNVYRWHELGISGTLSVNDKGDVQIDTIDDMVDVKSLGRVLQELSKQFDRIGVAGPLVAAAKEGLQKVGVDPDAATQTSGEDLDALLKNWDTVNRSRRSDEWFDGANVNEESRSGFQDALQEGGDRLQSHGMSKESTLTGAVRNLLNMLGQGLDPARRGGKLDTAPLVTGEQGSGAGIGTASGTSYKDGPFILVAREGQGLSGNLDGLGAILVNETNAEIVEALRQQVQAIRPDVVVESYANAGSAVRQVIQGPSARSDSDVVRQDEIEDESQIVVESTDEQRRDRVYQTPQFKQWFRDSKVVDDEGKPLIVYHGTTKNYGGTFETGTLSVESDLGAGFYFSSSTSDVNWNYANPLGADVQNRIGRRQEQLMDQDVEESEAGAIALEENLQNKGRITPVLLSIQNPVILGGDQATRFTYEMEVDEDGDPTGEESGTLLDLIDALYEIDLGIGDAGVLPEIAARIMQLADDGSVSANDVIELLRNEFQDEIDEDGNLIAYDIPRRVFAEMGFDGFIDHTVQQKFPTMEIPDGTTHYVAFKPTQIKSVNNEGGFSVRDPDILSQDEIVDEASPEQFRDFVIQSEQFQRFFGDSKVVDESGKPLILYRGLRSVKGLSRGGATERGRATMSFTDNADVAGVYSGIDSSGEVPRANRGLFQTPVSSLTPVFVRMVNPLDLTKLGATVSLWDVIEGMNWSFDVEYGDPNQDKQIGYEDVASAIEGLDDMAFNTNAFFRLPSSAQMYAPGGIRSFQELGDLIRDLGAQEPESIELFLMETEIDAFVLGDDAGFVSLMQQAGFDGLIHSDPFVGTGMMSDDASNALVRVPGSFGDDTIHTTWRPFSTNQVKSVNNQGTFDRSVDDILLQDEEPPKPDEVLAWGGAAGDLARKNQFKRRRDYKMAIHTLPESDAVRAMSPEERTAHIQKVGVRDALFALEHSPNAVGWYDKKIQAAVKTLAVLHPEILTKKQKRLQFMWALAVTSNGLKVDDNFNLAGEVFQSAGKHFPTDVGRGDAANQINLGLKLYNTLVDKWGVDKLAAFMLTPTTPKQLQILFEAEGIEHEISGSELITQEVYGAYVLGPKIGNGFFMNLHGELNQLTMDRWFMRTWGRWTGSLFKFNEELAAKQMSSFRSALMRLTKSKNWSVIRDDVNALYGFDIFNTPLEEVARRTQRLATKKETRDTWFSMSPEMNDLRKAGNRVATGLDGQVEIPANGSIRADIRKHLTSILAEIQAMPEYVNLSMADLQAALWYAEKRHYEQATEGSDTVDAYDDDEAPDYENAARDYVMSRGDYRGTIEAAVAEPDIALRLADRAFIEPSILAPAGLPESQQAEMLGDAAARITALKAEEDVEFTWKHVPVSKNYENRFFHFHAKDQLNTSKRKYEEPQVMAHAVYVPGKSYRNLWSNVPSAQETYLVELKTKARTLITFQQVSEARPAPDALSSRLFALFLAKHVDSTDNQPGQKTFGAFPQAVFGVDDNGELLGTNDSQPYTPGDDEFDWTVDYQIMLAARRAGVRYMRLSDKREIDAALAAGAIPVNYTKAQRGAPVSSGNTASRMAEGKAGAGYDVYGFVFGKPGVSPIKSYDDLMTNSSSLTVNPDSATQRRQLDEMADGAQVKMWPRRNLIAVHTMNEDKLLSAFDADLDGLTAPSIAVSQATTGHRWRGSVQIVLKNSAVLNDGQIYDSDVWSQRYREPAVVTDYAITAETVRLVAERLLTKRHQESGAPLVDIETALDMAASMADSYFGNTLPGARDFFDASQQTLRDILAGKLGVPQLAMAPGETTIRRVVRLFEAAGIGELFFGPLTNLFEYESGSMKTVGRLIYRPVSTTTTMANPKPSEVIKVARLMRTLASIQAGVNIETLINGHTYRVREAEFLGEDPLKVEPEHNLPRNTSATQEAEDGIKQAILDELEKNPALLTTLKEHLAWIRETVLGPDGTAIAAQGLGSTAMPGGIAISVTDPTISTDARKAGVWSRALQPYLENISQQDGETEAQFTVRALAQALQGIAEIDKSTGVKQALFTHGEAKQVQQAIEDLAGQRRILKDTGEDVTSDALLRIFQNSLTDPMDARGQESVFSIDLPQLRTAMGRQLSADTINEVAQSRRAVVVDRKNQQVAHDRTRVLEGEFLSSGKGPKAFAGAPGKPLFYGSAIFSLMLDERLGANYDAAITVLDLRRVTVALSNENNPTDKDKTIRRFLDTNTVLKTRLQMGVGDSVDRVIMDIQRLCAALNVLSPDENLPGQTPASQARFAKNPDLTPEQAQLYVDFLNSLRRAGEEYYEAKPIKTVTWDDMGVVLIGDWLGDDVKKKLEAELKKRKVRTMRRTNLEGSSLHGALQKLPKSARLDKDILFQTEEGELESGSTSGRGGPRGGYSRKLNSIFLNESADASTLMHEMAHFYLDELTRIAEEQGPDSEAYRKLQTLVQWMGMPSVDHWMALSRDQKRTGHEAFAHSFERFLYDGVSPNTAMEKAFRGFRKWMIAIYHDVETRLNKQYQKTSGGEDLPALTPDVREVFGAMLGVEAEANSSVEAADFESLFQTEEEWVKLGGTPEEYRRLQEMHREADEKMLDDLTRARLRAMAYAGNSQDAERRKLQRQYREARAALKPGIEASVRNSVTERARSWLRNGLHLDENGEVISTMGRVTTNKLNRGTVKEMVDARTFKRLDEMGVLNDEGADPSVVASMFGVDSGETLLDAVANDPPMEQAVERRLKAEMRRKHPELTDPKLIKEQIAEAVHNKVRHQIIARELQYLAREDRSHQLLWKAAKQVAFKQLALTPVQNILPSRYSVSARKARNAARQALKEGNRDKAMQAKRQEMLAEALVAAATEVRKEVQKFEKLAAVARKSDKKLRKTRDMNYVEVMRAALAFVDAGEKGVSPQQALSNIRQYAPEVLTNVQKHLEGLQTMMSELGMLKPTDRVKRYMKLPLDKFRLVAGTVEMLDGVSKASHSITLEGKRVNREQTVKDASDQLDLMYQDEVDREESGSPNTWDNLVDRVRSYKHALTRPEHLFREIGGVFPQLFARMKDAALSYRRMARVLTDEYAKDLKGLNLREDRRKIRSEELKFVFGRGSVPAKVEILGMLLHFYSHGADSQGISNRDKLLASEGWTEDGVNKFVNAMVKQKILTAEDFDFIRKVYARNEKLIPQIQRAHFKRLGYYMELLKVEEQDTPFGPVKGYIPASPDRRRVGRTMKFDEDNIAEMHGNMPMRNDGFTKSRSEKVAMKLDFNLGGLTRHYAQVANFVHMQPAYADVASILLHPQLQAKMEEKFGRTFNNAVIDSWLKAATNQTTEPAMNMIEKVVDGMSRSAKTAVMAVNIPVALMNLTGFGPILREVKPSYFMRAAFRYITEMPTVVREVRKFKSMDERIGKQMFEAEAMTKEIVLGTSPSAKIRKFGRFVSRNAYLLHVITQHPVDVIGFLASYSQALDEGKTRKQAERIATSLIDRTQMANAPEDLTQFEAGGPLMKAVFPFRGWAINFTNHAIRSLRADVRNNETTVEKATALLMTYTMTILMPSFGAFIIGAWLRDFGEGDDENEVFTFGNFVKSQVDTVLGGLPVFGDIARVGMANLDDETWNNRMPSLPFAKLSERLGKGAALFADDDPSYKDMADFAGAMAAALGAGIADPVIKRLGLALDDDGGSYLLGR